jgi:hypothetical protein
VAGLHILHRSLDIPTCRRSRLFTLGVVELDEGDLVGAGGLGLKWGTTFFIDEDEVAWVEWSKLDTPTRQAPQRDRAWFLGLERTRYVPIRRGSSTLGAR